MRAAELLGKELGMFVERRELTIEQRLAMMTDEQRLEEAKRLAERVRARLEADGQMPCAQAGAVTVSAAISAAPGKRDVI